MAHKDKAPRAYSLEYSLHSLLRKQHLKTQSLQTPRPVTAYPMQGGSKRLCLAGASALTMSEVAPNLQRYIEFSINFLKLASLKCIETSLKAPEVGQRASSLP